MPFLRDDTGRPEAREVVAATVAASSDVDTDRPELHPTSLRDGAGITVEQEAAGMTVNDLMRKLPALGFSGLDDLRRAMGFADSLGMMVAGKQKDSDGNLITWDSIYDKAGVLVAQRLSSERKART